MSWPWPNFTRDEMACSDGTPFPLTANSINFMNKLQALRTDLGFPFIISSAYRTESYNEEIGGAEDSAHVKALASDIQIWGRRAYLLISRAPSFGFTGIGVKQHGAIIKRFIHLDCKTGIGRPTIWSY